MKICSSGGLQHTLRWGIDMLTYEEASRLLAYDPETGVITRLVATRYNPVGSVAGTPSLRYLSVAVSTYEYQAHRLAWLLHHGTWPAQIIDHINGIGTDNRIANLRDVSQQENCRNMVMSKANTSGVTGVWWDRFNNKWQAGIVVNAKHINLGRYGDKFQAICARKSAEQKYGFHANHGRPSK